MAPKKPPKSRVVVNCETPIDNSNEVRLGKQKRPRNGDFKRVRKVFRLTAFLERDGERGPRVQGAIIGRIVP